MKIYLLIHEQDTDAAWGCDVKPFTDKQAAMDTMRKDWEDTIESSEFDTSAPITDEHYNECDMEHAVIRDGDDVENWRIEEHELDVQVAVEVKGGLVQNIYANADVHADVYDLDVSDFPDVGEEAEADRKEAELNDLVKSPRWHNVW